MGRRHVALTALVLLSGWVRFSVSDGCGCEQTQSREFDTTYADDVGENCKKCFTFVYDYFVEQNWTTRICVRNPNPGPTPLLVVSRQSANAIAFAVPLSIKGASSEYPSVCRTLCPISRSGNTTLMDRTAQKIVLDFWSKSPTHFEFELQKITNFAIGTNEPVALNLTVSHPAVLQYSMPDDLSTVRVVANSNTSECMILSIEDIECPFHDTHESVPQGGYRQTHTMKSAITVKRTSIYNEIYIVLLLNPDDSECKDDIITGIPGEDRFKQVTVEVIPVLYEWATPAVLVPLLVFLIFGIICCLCYHCQICIKIFPEVTAPISEKTSSTEAAHIRNFYVMSDMAEKKPWSSKSYQYAWNLCVIAIFYALPAVQLVYFSQMFMHASGNMDECYYNFRCAHQIHLGSLVISDFNHVFSNVGYIILGIVFIIIVKSRSSKDPNSANNKKKRIALQPKNEPRNQEIELPEQSRTTTVYMVDESETGIPPHYGLFYTMGWSLCMEGVMSLTYHICPKKSNFQFDTTFMYVICMVCIAQLYYARHQAIAPKAYSFWMMLAISIFLPFLGLFSTIAFWVLFVIWILCLVFMTFRYLVSPGARTCFTNLGCMCCKCCEAVSYPVRKAYVNSTFRDVSMLVAILVQLFSAIYLGLTGTDFNTIILDFYIINVVWYCIYYIGMKVIYSKVEDALGNFREKFPWTSIVYFCVFLGTLIASAYFYAANRAEWNKTPAESRERNDYCLSGFDYYDNHDVWHFLSSVSIFFLYLFLFTVDDDLKNRKMTHIVVF